MFWIWLFGFLIGGMFGFILACLLACQRLAEKRYENCKPITPKQSICPFSVYHSCTTETFDNCKGNPTLCGWSVKK